MENEWGEEVSMGTPGLVVSSCPPKLVVAMLVMVSRVESTAMSANIGWLVVENSYILYLVDSCEYYEL